MEITIAEALKLKNEIGRAVNNFRPALEYSHGVTYGVQNVDGHDVESNNQVQAYPDVMSRLVKLYGFSNEVHTAIGEFNLRSGIPKLVRERKNLESLMRFAENAVPQSRAREFTRVENVSGIGKVQTHHKFTPYQSEAELNDAIRKFRARIREIDNEVARLNAQTIVLPFSYEELDDVLLDHDAQAS